MMFLPLAQHLSVSDILKVVSIKLKERYGGHFDRLFSLCRELSSHAMHLRQDIMPNMGKFR